MDVSIRDADALRAVTPATLSAYARAAGWSAGERYRKHWPLTRLRRARPLAGGLPCGA